MGVRELAYSPELESNQFILSHWRANPYGCRGIGLPSRTGEQLVYPLALKSMVGPSGGAIPAVSP